MRSDTPCEILLAKVTMTPTGYPASARTVRGIYGDAIRAPDEGWWWIGATPRSAKRLRRDGMRVVGSVTTTWIPSQTVGPTPLEGEPEGERRFMYDDNDRIIGPLPRVVA